MIAVAFVVVVFILIFIFAPVAGIVSLGILLKVRTPDMVPIFAMSTTTVVPFVILLTFAFGAIFVPKT